MEAKGNSRLKTDNGLLGRRDRAKWNRSTVTPLSKWLYGKVTALVDLDSLHLVLDIRKDLWTSHPKAGKNTILRWIVTS